MKAYPPVVVVNEQDTVIGEAPLDLARARNMIYRIVFIVLENQEGKILLQHRAKHVKLFPDCWDISAGGHVDDGNSYEAAAHAELVEELGIKGLDLREAAHFYTETPELNGVRARRYVKMYTASYDGTPSDLGLEEVSAVRWVTRDEIKRLIETQPEKIAEGLLHTYQYVFPKQFAVQAAA